MQRLLFTIPDHVAKDLQEFVPVGERSKFVVRSIEIPLKKLQHGKKNKTPPASIYKPQFLKDLQKAERQAKKGDVYSEEHVLKKFGLL